ncbi:MAG: DUF4268 domain-containing protein [Candidatus Thiodiazotropha sp.]|nr:DUF4268 domain-containing protein [Candidatus Thiodiazotropha sp.]
MIAKDLGRLEKVDLRDFWVTEAGDFTPWLAQDENITLLGAAIGIELEVEAQEKSVGPFRADILCKDVSNEQWVLIENQLERTDHTHLGQLLTYGAGLNAVTIIWIASKFTEEHRAALDWLNEITDGRFNFFGLEVELWRIGNSFAAPKFNIISQPNEWARSITSAAKTVQQGELTEGKRLQLSFWTGFKDYMATAEVPFKLPKPAPRGWMSIPLGRSGARLGVIASFWNNEQQTYDTNEIRVQVRLMGEHAKGLYAFLLEQKDEIETELGVHLEWYNPDDATVCRIYLSRPALLNNQEQWPEYHQWLKDKIESFYRVFRDRIRRADLIELDQNEEV